jgi:GTP cyclohydrolase I
MDVQHVVSGALFDAGGACNMVMVRDISSIRSASTICCRFTGSSHRLHPGGQDRRAEQTTAAGRGVCSTAAGSGATLEQIASAINDVLKPQGVGVIIEAYHLCMMMRGVEKQNSKTITSAVRGLFRSDQRTREEFLTLAYHGRGGG